MIPRSAQSSSSRAKDLFFEDTRQTLRVVYPATQRNEPEDMNPRDQLHNFNSQTT